MNIHGLTITLMLKDMIKYYCVWKYIQFTNLIIETILHFGVILQIMLIPKKGNQKNIFYHC